MRDRNARSEKKINLPLRRSPPPNLEQRAPALVARCGAETKRQALETGAEGLFFGTLRNEIDMRVERAA